MDPRIKSEDDERKKESEDDERKKESEDDEREEGTRMTVSLF